MSKKSAPLRVSSRSAFLELAPASGITTSSLEPSSLAGSKLSRAVKPGKLPAKTSPWYLVAKVRLEPACCT